LEINVTAISQPITQQKGKNTWQEITVDFIGKKGPQKQTLRSFAGQAFTDFLKIQAPATVDVQVKKEGDFWQWKAATVIEGGTQNKAAVAQTAGTAKAGNWETSEERANKQRYIVRQSSISSALGFFGPRIVEATVEEVLDVAKKFETFVFTGEIPETVKKAGRKPKADTSNDDPIT
jgi:hypothetical protein